MRLHILGCSGSYPEAGGATSGYLVTAGEQRILLDMGSGVLSRLTALMDPAELDAVIITHWHYDHACDLLPLQYYLQVAGKKLPVYAPVNDAPLRALCVCPYLTLHDLRALTRLGGVAVDACPVPHPMPCFAVRLSHGGRTLVYTGDTSGYAELTAFARDTDMVLCDATFTNAQWTEKLPHLSAAMAAAFAATTDHARLVLTHIPPCNDGQTLLKEARAVYADTLLASHGLTLTV